LENPELKEKFQELVHKVKEYKAKDASEKKMARLD